MSSTVKLTIDDCMAPSPYVIQRDQTMAEAHALMDQYKIRHLPVLDGETLVGMVSIRDLHVLAAVAHVDPTNVTVGKAMHPDPYTVQRGTDLKEVVANLGARKFGSAIVLDGSKVVGVFTTVDAMRVLTNLL